MKYILFLVGFLFVSCNGGLSETDKIWIEKRIVEIHDSLNTNQNNSIVKSSTELRHLWNLTPNLSIPSNYRVGDIKEFIYEKVVPGSENMGMGVHVNRFYPIGWSTDGELFAYRYVTGFWTGEESIFLLDVISDKIKDKIVLKTFDSENSYNKHSPNDQAVNDFLSKYKITPHFDFSMGSSFTSNLTGQKFNFNVKADDQLFEYETFNNGKIDIYVTTNDNKHKKIATVSEEGSFSSFNIHGIIKSPVENRAIVIAVVSEHGYEGESDCGIQLFGCNLNIDSFDSN